MLPPLSFPSQASQAGAHTRPAPAVSVSSPGNLAGSPSAAAVGAVGWHTCAELGVAIVGATALALVAPLATTVFALLLFGVLHNYFEIRYVVGRFGGLFHGRLAEVVLTGLTVIVLLRLFAPPGLARPLEIVALYGLLGGVMVLRLGSNRWLLAVSLVALAGAAGVSLREVDLHFVMIAHLHNVLPLLFLWEWTVRRPSTAPSRVFLGLHLTWAAVLPLAILLGLFGDLSWADPTPAASVVGDVDTFVRSLVPPLPAVGPAARWLTVFALLQLMHYYVWCRFFPSVGAAEAAQFDATVRRVGLPSGRRLSAIIGLLAVAVFALMWADFRLGRSVYGALAGYHAYLEYALLVMFILVWSGPGAQRAGDAPPPGGAVAGLRVGTSFTGDDSVEMRS